MKKGILLLQMGGACCGQAVQGFLYNLFRDPYIIQLPKFMQPFQNKFADMISKKRSPVVAENYEMIGGSPILFETMCQAKALEKRLGGEYKCYVAMRYSYPFLADSYKEIEADGIDDLTVLPLYPQYSLATSGSSIIECKEVFAETGFDQRAKIRYIESWEDNPHFIELITQRIEDKLEELQIQFKRKELELNRLKEEDSNVDQYFNRNIKILFSAHGLPVKYIENGDPYQRQVEDSVNLIVQNLADKLNLRSYKNQLKSEALDIDWMITFQSRVGPVQWLEPNTEDILEEFAQDGVKNIIIVPISFVGDHIETLHELGIEYAEIAHEGGVENYMITRLPKANPLLIEALADNIINQDESSKLQSTSRRKQLSLSNRD